MRLECGDILLWSDDQHWHCCGDNQNWIRWRHDRIGQAERGSLPDLTDPATAGCLLAMLVAVDPGAGWGVSCGPDVGWRATSCDHDLSGATCGEALARALLVVWEAAP